MKMYAQFYTTGVMTGEPIEACGDRAVLILDARYKFTKYIVTCKRHAKKHGFIGYKFVKADRFIQTDPTDITLV